MKKNILVLLIAVLCARNVLADGRKFGDDVASFQTLSDLYNDVIEDAAARDLCKRLVAYAVSYNYEPRAPLDDGTYFYAKSSDCDTLSISDVKGLAAGMAGDLWDKDFSQNSQDASGLVENSQDVPDCVLQSVKIGAWNSRTSVVRRSLEPQGYNFDFNNSEVACSNTSSDYKCVINVVVNKGAKNYTACYKVPYNVCESGAYFVHSHEVMGKIGIEYYDDNCAPIYGQ